MTDHLVAEEILELLPARPWAGKVYRVMLGDYPPDRENTVGARWNPPGQAAIYVSESADIAIAEVEHHLRQQSRPIRKGLRRTLYQIEVELSATIDLTQAVVQLAAAGIHREQLFADDMHFSQGIGKTATWLDRDALRVPSARIEGCNWVIYPSWARLGAYRFEVTVKTDLGEEMRRV